MARQRILVLNGHGQRRFARRWAAAWSRLHPPSHGGWLLLVPDKDAPHECRVEGLRDGPAQRSVVLRVAQDQLRLALVGSGDLHRDTESLEDMILRLQAAVCPGLPVVFEGLFDGASRDWFAELGRGHGDWWLSWRPGLTAGPGLRMVSDSPPMERRWRP